MANPQNYARPTRQLLALLLVAHAGWSFAAGSQEGDKLLDKKDYHGELEEVIVVGKQPEWRNKQDEEQQWRPSKFELPEEPAIKGRIEWFPEYTKDERDNFRGVSDRLDEKPEIKIFEWKF